MRLEDYMQLVESRRTRRNTVIIMFCNLILLVIIAVLCYYTFTAFGQTTLTQGVQNFIAWIQGGAR